MHPVIVDNDLKLRQALAILKESPAIGVDTEFIKRKSFRGYLGLLQISDGERCWLVDPMSLTDLSALVDLLCMPSVVKIFHDMREDVAVLYHALGIVVEPIFDTQVAAPFLGLRQDAGYAALVEHFFSHSLEKSHSVTMSDWRARPLTKKQKVYAAADVVFLPSIYESMQTLLEQRKVQQGFKEESARRLQNSLFATHRSLVRKRLLKKNYSKKKLITLRAILEWRDWYAYLIDQPQTWIIPNDVVLSLAEAQPRDFSDLTRTLKKLLPRRKIRSWARYRLLIAYINYARKNPNFSVAESEEKLTGERNYPIKIKQPIILSNDQREAMLKKMQHTVVEYAEQLKLPAEFLLPLSLCRNLLSHLCRNTPLNDQLCGWRYDKIVNGICETYEAELAKLSSNN